MSLSAEDVAVAWRDRQLEFVRFLVERIAALESKVTCLESYSDAASRCVHWTKDDVSALTEKINDLDARTVVAIDRP